MPRRPASEGIYFVIRMPVRWQLVAFRFDDHPDGGHPEFWEAHVTPMLANVWAPRLFVGIDRSKLRRLELRLKSELDLHYDGFPRGRVTWIDDLGRFAIYHGGNLKSGMKLTRRAIEQAFGITGRADWEFDEHEQCSSFSTEGLCSALDLRERWKTISPDFD